MPTIVSFYQRFPNEAPPLNLSAFDRTGYTYAENFRRNERCYEAEQCEVTSDDGSVVLSLDVRIRPRGGEIEALPRVMLSVYSEGMPFQVRRMELRTGDTTYAILPDNVQQYTMRGDTDGGFLETMAIPLGKVGMKMLLEASDAAEARWVIQGARTDRRCPSRRRRRRRFTASAWTARNPPSPTSPRSCGTRITVQKPDTQLTLPSCVHSLHLRTRFLFFVLDKKQTDAYTKIATKGREKGGFFHVQ